MILVTDEERNMSVEFMEVKDCAKYVYRHKRGRARTISDIKSAIYQAMRFNRKWNDFYFRKMPDLPRKTNSSIDLRICNYFINGNKSDYSDKELAFKIKNLIAEKYAFPEGNIKYNRKRNNGGGNGKYKDKIEYCKLRQIAMYLIRMKCKELSLKDIGGIFAGQDHATVINSIEAVKDYINTKDKTTLDTIEYVDQYTRKPCS